MLFQELISLFYKLYVRYKNYSVNDIFSNVYNVSSSSLVERRLVVLQALIQRKVAPAP